MSPFSSTASQDGLHVKLWRGESMCLIGMDIDAPEPDFVGFAIEVRSPGSGRFYPLRNRIAFDYPADQSVTGARKFESTEAPFQKFRWVHFPKEPRAGTYSYRVTKMHMPADGTPVAGTSLTLDIDLDTKTYSAIDVGFTRNFASSQAYAERFKNRTDILPPKADDGLDFVKPADSAEVYRWLGFEATAIIFAALDQAVADPSITLDVLAYDLNEGDMVEKLKKLGDRLRIVIDSSDPHVTAESCEQRAAEILVTTAGKEHVRRTHFGNLQHHKVIIAKRNGVPFKVITGSTNFSYRGLYIQANNAIAFEIPAVAALYEEMFEQAFGDPAQFAGSPLAAKWHAVFTEGLPNVHVCFSPHASSTDLSLVPVGGAIDQATSNVFYSIAFLNQIRSGPVIEAIRRLTHKDVFSYGIVNETGTMELDKPDGSKGMVDFAYLAGHAPEPFASEWRAGQGINIHNKFVVTDFNLPTAKVFTGSSNLSPSGEKNNGDHLIMIEDQRIATAFAIEAVRLFDHLQFRNKMQETHAAGAGTVKSIRLRKPTQISGEPAWFEAAYKPGSQKARDRLTFGH